MPMTWNAGADAKLMMAIIHECGIRINQQNYENLAFTMGCTPKAIQHRIAKMRGVAGGGITAAQGHANADKASKTQTGRKKAGVVKACTPCPGDNDDEAAVALTPPPTIDRSRGKKRNVKRGDDEGGSSKKIKTEGAENEDILGTEDIGEGLRQANNGSDDE